MPGWFHTCGSDGPSLDGMGETEAVDASGQQRSVISPKGMHDRLNTNVSTLQQIWTDHASM